MSFAARGTVCAGERKRLGASQAPVLAVSGGGLRADPRAGGKACGMERLPAGGAGNAGLSDRDLLHASCGLRRAERVRGHRTVLSDARTGLRGGPPREQKRTARVAGRCARDPDGTLRRGADPVYACAAGASDLHGGFVTFCDFCA